MHLRGVTPKYKGQHDRNHKRCLPVNLILYNNNLSLAKTSGCKS